MSRMDRHRHEEEKQSQNERKNIFARRQRKHSRNEEPDYIQDDRTSNQAGWQQSDDDYDQTYNTSNQQYTKTGPPSNGSKKIRRNHVRKRSIVSYDSFLHS
ncbi:hypothetical protein TMUPMC115_1364 [Tetragenococcus muriaticus PMC-11-5]|uniref:Uncharacterized protein n=1 Tax=Tetragenococcus muriaticus PMC-11-5 TaxID=1302649 RepID=A0A091C0X4_9ENTE|nr:hypothetical protein [Tetragenococcus muriaticus]KFN91481.1 hypothetical protein TMUPMC115_1364 [Tetragenococcus muriaticus PMC-11-5]